jgi:hypothetical protein
MPLSREKFNEFVEISDFDSLIGEIENVWFDCKSQPYQVENNTGKRDLAKDVSSFLNVKGGIILIGIKTEKSATRFGDEIKETRPFAQELVNTSQYKDIIKSWIYPEAEGIEVVWTPIKNDPAKGIVLIKIPNQKESIKPFLITKTLDENKQVETVFGYVERKDDNNEPLTIIDMQKTLRSGFNYENQLKERFDEMETLLQQITERNDTVLEKKTDAEESEVKIAKIIEQEKIKDRRNIIISAYPNQIEELKTIFSTTNNSIKKHLETPPSLRYAGWNLETLDQAKMMNGELIRVVNGDRKIINLYRDGSLIFIGRADYNFLAWASSPEKQKINPVALIEIIYNFVNFYNLVINDFKSLPEKISFRIDLKNMHLNGIKSRLAPYQINSTAQMFDIDTTEAPENDFAFTKTFLTKDYDAGLISYEIIKEIYFWFGIEENKIPYTKDEESIKKIDPESIKNIK